MKRPTRTNPEDTSRARPSGALLLAALALVLAIGTACTQPDRTVEAQEATATSRSDQTVATDPSTTSAPTQAVSQAKLTTCTWVLTLLQTNVTLLGLMDNVYSADVTAHGFWLVLIIDDDHAEGYLCNVAEDAVVTLHGERAANHVSLAGDGPTQLDVELLDGAWTGTLTTPTGTIDLRAEHPAGQ